MINKNIIIISSIDWTTHWQMHHQLATSLVSNGNRVLFVENTGARGLRLGDIGRIRERISNWLQSTRGFREIQPGLTVFSPLFLPFPYLRIAGWLNRVLLSMSIKRWVRSARFNDPLAITFLPTPLGQALIRDLDPILVVYYCANDMAGSSPDMHKLRPWEDLLFARADIVFAISDAIFDRATIFSNHVHLFPPGVDFELFESHRKSASIPDDLASVQRPVVGYVGALSNVVDQDLISKMAIHMPEVTFVLVGPQYTDVRRLEKCSNVKLFGSRPHDLIPAYIKGFDVALIPYVVNQFTDSVYSCKLNEYLAMGVPVVATNMREIRRFVERHGTVIDIGNNTPDFIEKVRLALVEESECEKRHIRVSVAKLNGWDQRFSDISRVIDHHLIEKLDHRETWQKRFASFYKRRQLLWSSGLTLILLVYVLVFYSPLVWLMGDQLAVRHSPRAADAIVVFSGDGESSYINQSYQRRTLDAINYYKSGYAPLIILSSGRDQTFSEVEVIKSLLINRGVPVSAIQILEKYPRSTFQNVAFVKESLDKQGVKSILLITSPYHSRRALWVWRKAMPDIEVVSPEVVDTPKASPQWRSNIDQIKVICYEYLAIAYYRYRGWL